MKPVDAITAMVLAVLLIGVALVWHAARESMPSEHEVSGELCARCGDVDEDRRTLWLACFYDLSETGVPFEERMVRGLTYEKTGTKTLEPFKVQVPLFDGEPVGPERDHRFFTLRICKACRGDWISSTKKWFEAAPDRGQSPGTGIFVREYGKLVEITEEEWERRKRAAEAKR